MNRGAHSTAFHARRMNKYANVLGEVTGNFNFVSTSLFFYLFFFLFCLLSPRTTTD